MYLSSFPVHLSAPLVPGGSWSYLGTDATSIPLESFTMNLGFVDRPTILHEFGHSLGLIHEHQSPFEGGFEWNREEVRMSNRRSLWGLRSVQLHTTARSKEFSPL